MRLEIFKAIYSMYGEWGKKEIELAEEVEQWIGEKPKTVKEKGVEVNERVGKNKKRR